MPPLRVATFNVKHGDDGCGRIDLRRMGEACAGLSADVLARARPMMTGPVRG